MEDPIVSEDGNWVWDGNEWVPNQGNVTVTTSDSVISGDLIATKIVNSVDSDVVAAAMSGVVEVVKELDPTSVSSSDFEKDRRVRVLEIEKILLDERNRMRKRKRALNRLRIKKKRNFIILVALATGLISYILIDGGFLL